MLIAQAEAEKIKKIGEAEASSIEAVGKAEAEKMRLKAAAYRQYGEAAKTALVLEALPKVPTTAALRLEFSLLPHKYTLNFPPLPLCETDKNNFLQLSVGVEKMII